MATEFQKEVSKNLANIPFIYYGSYQIEVHDLYFFSLYYDGILPAIKLTFYDTLNVMKDKGMPLDDTKIKIFFNPRSTQLKEILMQFKITSFTVNSATYTIEGIIDINLLHISQYKSYPKMTSHKVLQSIAREAGLGFNTNIDDTNDQMTWINPGLYVSEFMEQVLESSYKSDTAFLTCYIDYYYNFNVIDVAKELERNIDEQLGVADISVSNLFDTSEDAEKLTNLIISNDESIRESNLYFEDYRILNNSMSVSLQAGYKNIVKYYDNVQKELLVFNIDSITSQDKRTIILKGAPQDDEFFNMNTNTYYLGKLEKDNAHKNYNFSWIQNEKNLFDLEKMGLEVTMRTPNFTIYKFQKIKVLLSNQTSTPSADLVNGRLSGDWLVIDIKFVYVDNAFKQTIRLIKRELELTEEELSNEAPVMAQNEVGENNSNTEENTPVNNTPLPPAGATYSSVNNTIGEPEQLIVDNNGRVDAESEQLINNLVAEVRPLARQLIQKSKVSGVNVKIKVSLITDIEQNNLYYKGRDSNGNITNITEVVTNLKAGDSIHNYGLAFDIGVYDDAGKYLEKSPMYDRIGPIGKSLGLSWGGDKFKDRDNSHYELVPYWGKYLSENILISELKNRKQNNKNLLV